MLNYQVFYFVVNSLLLILKLAPKLGELVKNRIRSEGSNFQIFCSAEEGSEPFFFEWTKNGQLIRSGPDVKYRIENSEMSSTLSIKSVERHDAGNYSCLVKNAVGTDSKLVSLTVKGNPSSILLC